MKLERICVAAAGAALAVVCGCGPDDGTREFDAGKSAFDQGDWRKAERSFAESAVRAPANVDTWMYLARAQLALGSLVDARKSVQKAEELAGGETDVKLLSAQIAWHAKDYEGAKKSFAALANDKSLAPELQAEGWAGVGIVEMTCDRRDQARVAFLRAIRLDRRNAAARYHLGLLYRDSFTYGEAALEQFNVYVRLDEVASPRVQRVQRSLIPELKESIARAAADRPGAAKRDSAAAAAAIAKAEAAWKKGNFKTAKGAYQDALKSDPLSYPAALGLAKAHLKTDSTQKGQLQALEAYKQACSLRPSAISTFLAAAELAVKVGHNAEATAIYSRAVAADPASLEALDGLIRSLRRAKGNSPLAQAYQSYRDFLAAGKKK